MNESTSMHIVFILDTSVSMNQKCLDGTSLFDVGRDLISLLQDKVANTLLSNKASTANTSSLDAR